MRAGAAIGVRPDGSAGHLNVTPLIDIVMVLIIFFLLVGQLAMDRKGAVDLPEAASGEPATVEHAPIAVAIGPDLAKPGQSIRMTRKPASTKASILR